MFRGLKKFFKFLANYKRLLYVYLLLITIVLGLLLNKMVFRIEEPIVPAFAGTGVVNKDPDSWFEIILDKFIFNADNCEKLLNEGLPVLSYYAEKDVNYKKATQGLMESIFSFITNVDLNNPTTYFHDQIPLVAKIDYPILARYQEREVVYTPGEEIVPNSEEPSVPIPNELPANDKPPLTNFNGKILVGIYHSHNSETYRERPGDIGDYHVAGQNGDVVDLGEVLSNYLQNQYQIGTVHSKTIHDYPVMRQAYQRSVVTAQQMLKTYPTIEVLLDIHRDAASRELTVTEIQGKKTARIMIVVGTDRLGLAHPNWEKNYEFAKKIVTEMERMYPGLSRGIVVADARYNQHLSPGSLIIEIGSHENSKEEALASIPLFGDVLASVLKK
ncbi:MAG TPA: stage II sporulation protein P [Clostridia bacterium]|nr:stage II sporulation protein P [Clostridia bacterium]